MHRYGVLLRSLDGCTVPAAEVSEAQTFVTRRITISFSVALLAVFFASTAPAQVRGMRASGPGSRNGVSTRLGARSGVAQRVGRRDSAGTAFLPFPYLYPDYDYQPIAPEAPPVPEALAPPVQAAVPTPAPVASLLLENRGGQWVRVPTGDQLPPSASSVQPLYAQPSDSHPEADTRTIEVPHAPPCPLQCLFFVTGIGRKLRST